MEAANQKTCFFLDAESRRRLEEAKRFYDNGDHNKALAIFEDMRLSNTNQDALYAFSHEQGLMLFKLWDEPEKALIGFPYLLGAAVFYSEHERLSVLCACLFNEMAMVLGSVFYYKKFLKKAKQAPPQSNLESLIEAAERIVADSKTTPGKILGPALKLVQVPKPQQLKDELKELKLFWVRLDVNIKKDFVKVSIEKLLSFVKAKHHIEGRDSVNQALVSAKKDLKWDFWICRTICSKKFSSYADCKTHLEQEHALDFKPSFQNIMVKRIGKSWAQKISVGGWEPVDIAAAVEIMMNLPEDVTKKGWSKKWPLAADDERSELLKKIKSLLLFLYKQDILSGSVRDWMVSLLVSNLEKLGVLESVVGKLGLLQTPQSICFLESHELSEILSVLKRIKRKRDDGTDQVSRAVDIVLSASRVKEKIDFDHDYSFLLLDKRLLKSSNARFDDDGNIGVYDPNAHYTTAHAQGDYIISWLADNSVDKIFPRPIREHSLDIWLSVMKAIQFACRSLRTKYAKKEKFVNYAEALSSVKHLCMNEDKREMNPREDQQNRYASLLCSRFEEMVSKNSPASELFLCAVRDVLEGASNPTIDFPGLENCMDHIRERKNISYEEVLKSIDHLESEVPREILLMDSKILLIDNSRISLLNNLTRLSFFDNRTYILPVLKAFLLNGIQDMESKAKSDAAAADLERELVKSKSHLKSCEKKDKNNSPKNTSNSKKKKKKAKSSKGTSTSASSPLAKMVEHEPEPESPSSNRVDEDSMEQQDTPAASERGRQDNQEESTNTDHETQNMPGESSLSEHSLGEAAARYNSAFDMTIKALLNIEVLKEDLKLIEQPEAPSPPQNFFSAYLSGEIKDKQLYSFLLGEFLAFLEVTHPMPSDAAEVLVAILEFWHESLVTRLFTLEENERMDCRKCRRKSNYPDQSSYGIVVAADSIKDLSSSFGQVGFVDILKVIRMENKMLCDERTGGCGETNFAHHTISTRPPIFTIVLVWEKNESEEDISKTTKALEVEIDISRLYEGLKPNTNYRLVSMVGCGEEEEQHICIAYEERQWVNLGHESFEGKVVGKWEDVVKFCGEKKVRPEILFYEDDS